MRSIALKVLRIVVRYLRKIQNIKQNDDRYLLCTKFFLFYSCSEHQVVIKPTVDPNACVICTREKNRE